MMKISSVVVEKDFWVCVVLDYLMNVSKYKDYFIFKGGTSLSYCFKYFNDDNKRSFKVRIITIARTFWEKILILYTECNRPTDKKTPDRYSRHYYDVYMIYKSKYFKEIIRDKNLFEDVKHFKTKYYRNSWSNIENVTLNNIRLIPPEKRLETIKDDYQKMADMFFKTPPSFEELLVGLRELEEELNNL